MNLNQSALMKAIGVGVGLGVLAGIIRNIPLVGLGCCCIGWALWLGVGASYGYFDQQGGMGGPPDTGNLAIGGAISGAVGGLVWGLVAGITSFVMTSVFGLATADYSQVEQYGVPPELATQLGSSAAMGAIGIPIGMCVGLLFYAVLGAIGGLIYAMIAQNQNRSTTPPAV